MQQPFDDRWRNLTIERAIAPIPVSDDEFRSWMHDRSIFVSAVMDDQMRTYRARVREGLLSWGARAEMWEQFAPQDLGPQRAYLDGVDRSSVFLLLLGSRYGVVDDTGYSPTHKENNRASDRHITRLLFVEASATPSDRDGRLNDWLNSLYVGISGVQFQSPEELWKRIESSLRELAAEDQQFWIKLGDFVFPGEVEQKRTREGVQITISARVKTVELRNALLLLSGDRSSVDIGRLTWSNYSLKVRVEQVESTSTRSGHDTIKITCGNRDDSYAPTEWTPVGQGDAIKVWVRWAFFGEAPDNANADLQTMFTSPKSDPLPSVLKSVKASGWLASGLSRLYMVEEVARRYDGQFDMLQIGPATARGISVSGQFHTKGWSNSETVPVTGAVRLSV